MDKFINKFKEGTKFVNLESSVDASLLADTDGASNTLLEKNVLSLFRRVVLLPACLKIYIHI